MSMDAFCWSWDNSEASGLELLALIAIADTYQSCGNPHGYTPGGGKWPGYDYVARRCHVSEIEAEEAVSKLISLGELTIDHQRGWFELPIYEEEDRRRHEEWIRINNEGARSPAISAKRTPKQGGVVYLITSTSHALVKIGHSTNVEARLRSIQNMSPAPISVVWTAPGGRELEQRLHADFARYRVHGEWFDFGSADPLSVVPEAAHRLAVDDVTSLWDGR